LHGPGRARLYEPVVVQGIDVPFDDVTLSLEDLDERPHRARAVRIAYAIHRGQ
jgi:hypothetical protein